MTPELRIFTFGAAWGLPTAGPFGLKLEASLRMLDVPYERVYEDDHRKGPKRKSPWIEDGNVRMGDTELILAYLKIDPDEGLSSEERARSHVLTTMLQEGFHQIFEYELLVDERGHDP